MPDLARLWKLCENGLQTISFELVELEYQQDQHGWVLRVYVDHPPTANQRVSVADCAAASRHLSTLLDVDDVISNAYRLEVSSPGVQRPVRKQTDFKRFVGRALQVQMQEAIDGRKKFIGRLKAVADGEITVEVEGTAYTLPLEKLRRARLEEESA